MIDRFHFLTQNLCFLNVKSYESILVIRNLNLKVSKIPILNSLLNLGKVTKNHTVPFKKNYILQKMNTHLVSLEIEVVTKEFT